MEYTIQQLAKLSGVTRRTLRYYDQIGLLRPARTTEAGYRIYGPSQVDRLQHILFYRALGLELGLPEYLVRRQPFPGPGLGIRVLGEVTAEKVRVLQDADAIFREEMAKAGLDRKVDQYFAVLTGTRTVGVMGDGRTYDYTLALRGVTTTDFMTADWARIPYEVLERCSGRIINEVRGVNRVVYDVTSKPPATIEWE